MAAITAIEITQPFAALRNVSAQATTGQTDWFYTPRSARFAMVFLNVTAVAGTTPILTPSCFAADPVLKDDAYVIRIGEAAAYTGITAAAQYAIQIGAGVTGIADDVTNSATADSYLSINAVLPLLMGVQILNDRTTGDETYTYSLSIHFRS